MGGAKYLGRDYGMKYTKSMVALELFLYWLIGGLPLLSFFSILVFPEPNFVVPITLYISGGVFLLMRYTKIDKQGVKDE